MHSAEVRLYARTYKYDYYISYANRLKMRYMAFEYKTDKEHTEIDLATIIILTLSEYNNYARKEMKPRKRPHFLALNFPDCLQVQFLMGKDRVRAQRNTNG